MTSTASPTDAMIFFVKKTEYEMMVARGYTPSQYQTNTYNIAEEDFWKQYPTIPYNRVFKDVVADRTRLSGMWSNGVDAVLIYYVFHSDTHLKKDFIDMFTASMLSHQATKGIIISPKKMHSNAAGSLEKSFGDDVQFFLDEELTYNPLNHFRSPIYTVLDDEQKAQLIEETDVRLDTMRIMRRNEPVAKFLGLEVGTVVRIERKSYKEDATIVKKVVTNRIVLE